MQGVDAVKYVNAKAVDKDVWPPKYCKVRCRSCPDAHLEHTLARKCHPAVILSVKSCCKLQIELELSEGRKVAFCDSRRFARARFQVHTDAELRIPLQYCDCIGGWTRSRSSSKSCTAGRRRIR